MVVLKIPTFPWDFSAGLRKVQAARVLHGAKSNNGSKGCFFFYPGDPILHATTSHPLKHKETQSLRHQGSNIGYPGGM